jgi:hypothetical protein
MTANKNIQKAVRLTPDQLVEIETCMEANGIPDFSAFAHIAFRTLLNRFADEQRIKNIDLPALFKYISQQTADATAPIHWPQASEDKTDDPKKIKHPLQR